MKVKVVAARLQTIFVLAASIVIIVNSFWSKSEWQTANLLIDPQDSPEEHHLRGFRLSGLGQERQETPVPHTLGDQVCDSQPIRTHIYVTYGRL